MEEGLGRWFLGFLVKGFGVKLGLKGGLFLGRRRNCVLVRHLKELFVDELRRELLEHRL